MEIHGRKYKLNPETLQFEVVKFHGKRKWSTLIGVGFILLVTAVGMRVVFDNYAKSPRLTYYEKKNRDLRFEYEIMSKQLRADEELLSELKLKDDNLYRSIIGLEPLPASMREAGIGGAPRYTDLEKISDPDLFLNVTKKLDEIEAKANVQSVSFKTLESAAIEKQQLLACLPSIQPLDPADLYWLTSSFGNRFHPVDRVWRFHHGVDLSGRVGTNIHATGDGVVKLAAYNSYGYGNEVVVDHGFGYETIYAHLHDIHVKKGDKVTRGQIVGTMGNTGKSTGPHLHYEVRKDNRAVNPMHFYHEDLSPQEYDIIASRALVE